LLFDNRISVMIPPGSGGDGDPDRLKELATGADAFGTDSQRFILLFNRAGPEKLYRGISDKAAL
jgi:hypothetical protein